MRVTQFISIMAALLISGSAAASLGDYEIVSVPIVDIEMGAEGEDLKAIAQYSNGCYEPWFSEKGVKNNKLVLVHLAQYFKDTICTRALEFKKLRFNVETLANGIYEIKDGNDGDTIGLLKKTDESAKIISESI